MYIRDLGWDLCIRDMMYVVRLEAPDLVWLEH